GLECGSVKCIQINMGKRVTCAAELNLRLLGRSSSLVFITEPHLARGGVTSFGST
ncbi:Hypothetical protein FKW44_010903, partial [Caligus rogercresseyi]